MGSFFVEVLHQTKWTGKKKGTFFLNAVEMVEMFVHWVNIVNRAIRCSDN